MRSKLFTLAAAVSAVLFVATVAMWVRSYGRCDFLGYKRVTAETAGVRISDWQSWTDIGGGAMLRMVIVTDPDTPPFPQRWSWTVLGGGSLSYPWRSARQEFWNRLGFGYNETEIPPNYDYHLVYFPLWFPVSLFAATPALWMYLQFRSRAPGLCRVCGYDLRATPGRCPECGTVPGEKAAP